jgi:predicted DsbA family dithiol-disulfide isomerase
MPNTFWFDFIDPLSYLQELELVALGSSIERIGFELAPPPEPLTAVSDARWKDRWAEARRFAATTRQSAAVELAPPSLVPWSRKAHELHLHAKENGRGDEIRRAIFEAYFSRGEDIGRVDRLIALAVAVGLDRTAAKAALDVDRHQEGVVEARRAAAEAGITDTPTLVVADEVLRGFHNRAALGTLVRGA